MRTLTTGQQAIIDSTVKSVTWLFHVTNKYLQTYYWSTKTVAALGTGTIWGAGTIWGTGTAWSNGGDGSGYAFKITNFSGITMARPKTESGIMQPSHLDFSVVNKDSLLSASDFEGGYVKAILMIGDTVAEQSQIGIWKFLIKKVSPVYQSLAFQCEDFFQQYLEGNYPSLQYKITGTPTVWGAGTVWAAATVWSDGTNSTGEVFSAKVHDIFPTTNGVGDFSDWVCIPLPFGTCYIPLRPVYTDGGWYYVLGPTVALGAAITYSIAKVRSPRDYSVKAEYAVTFTQVTKTSPDGHAFRVFTAALAAPPADGLFMLGDHYYDLPTKFTRSDTVSLTDFADVIKFVLKDMGVSPLDIDDASFTTAKTTFAGWGLACNGAFWKVTTREKALSSLLTQCHSTLIIGEQIELRVLDSTSQKTIAAADIIKPKEVGIGSFKHSSLDRTLIDCGDVRYSPTDDAQDVAINALVAAKTTKRNIAETVLETPFIQSATVAKEIAQLYYQRKLLKKSEQRVTVKGNCSALEPSDFITLTGANYGGTHDLIIDSMTIKRDVSIDLKCTEFSDAIENYA